MECYLYSALIIENASIYLFNKLKTSAYPPLPPGNVMYSTVTKEYGIIYLKTEQKSLACLSPWGCRVEYDLATQQQQTLDNC